MKRLIIVIGMLVLVVALTYARAPKSDYPWTGSDVEVGGDHTIVQKGEEKWEFTQDNSG